ncbi:hypothetical protein K2Z84_21420 [Candidatus Binatia bacterium]|nr:hypothetical protein [Candidatus Binatia bacterium]
MSIAASIAREATIACCFSASRAASSAAAFSGSMLAMRSAFAGSSVNQHFRAGFHRKPADFGIRR